MTRAVLWDGVWIHCILASALLRIPPLKFPYLAPSFPRSLPPRRPCLVQSLPRSFPSSTFPPSTLPSSTDALWLPSIIAFSLLPLALSLPPSIPPIVPPSSATLPCSLPPSFLPRSLPTPSLPATPAVQLNVHRVCVFDTLHCIV